MKDRLRFDDTAVPIQPSNLLPEPGLVMLELTAGKGGRYIAPLDNLSPSRVKSPAAFAGWWSNPVMKLTDGKTWSRRDLVLTLVNQEGDAHVDPTLDPDYERLARLNGLGWMFVDERGERPVEGNAVAAAVRQIAHEVIATLRREQANGRVTFDDVPRVPLTTPATDSDRGGTKKQRHHHREAGDAEGSRSL